MPCCLPASLSSRDGETTKLLLQLQDGLQVEAVVMQYDTTGKWLAAWSAIQYDTTVGGRQAGMQLVG